MAETRQHSKQEVISEQANKRPLEENEPENMSKTHDKPEDAGTSLPTRSESKKQKVDGDGAGANKDVGLSDTEIAEKRARIKDLTIQAVKNSVHSRSKKASCKVSFDIPGMKAGIQLVGDCGEELSSSKVMVKRDMTKDIVQWLGLETEGGVIGDCKSNVVTQVETDGKMVDKMVPVSAKIVKAVVKIKANELMFEYQSNIHDLAK